MNDKQMDQWNVIPPLLYLWSRTDWTARHKAIAEEHGHFSNLSPDMPASPLCPPLPSEEEQKEAEDIISEVIGDISVINNVVMEMKQEDITSRKGKEKVDPGPRMVESRVKTGPTVLKQMEEKDAGTSATAIEEVKKPNDRNQGREKKGPLEGTGSHREARGTDRQNDGRGDRADQNSDASSPLKEARANKPHNEGSVRGPHKEYTDNRHHNEGGATQDHQEARVLRPHHNFRETEPCRIGKWPDAQGGSSYYTREIKRRLPEMRTSSANHIGRRSPPAVIDSRSNKMRQSEDRATGIPNNGNVSDMDISSPDNRQNASAIRGDNTASWVNNNNPSRYDSTSNRGNSSTSRRENNNNNGYNSRYDSRYDSSINRGNSTLQRENNNTDNGDILPMAGFQYNNDLLMEGPIETRQLDSQLDFSDLGPILSNGNDDFNDMARKYPTPSSYDWSYGSGLGSGSGSILERGFDDFGGLGRFYGSQDENRYNNFGAGTTGQSGNTFHNSTYSSSYGLSGLGGSTSTSAMDRYAPRLDETNFLRPGGSSGFSGGSHQFHQGGFGALSGSPPYSYDMHGLDRREMPAHRPDLSGFGARQQHSFRPPPGSSGGWLDD